MIDILMVSYNSEKWLDGCVESIAASQYDLGQVRLCFVDNSSTDGSVVRLSRLREKYAGVFGGFEIFASGENMGFGRGNNMAATLGNGEVIFCLNIDTTIYPDTLAELERAMNASKPTVGLWELRQFPYEHPKFYDPLTHETSWASGACFAMRRELFEKIGGFDEHIFMYGEDVDLSWRVRAEGYTLEYVPRAVVNHYCYQKANEVKPTQYIYSLVNNYLLRCKFGGAKERAWWSAHMANILRKRGIFPHARKQLVSAIWKSRPAFAAARKWNKEHREAIQKQNFTFMGWDYEIARDGAFYENMRPDTAPLVSVLVRTCGRPDTLRETLQSIRMQTYPNIETIVVEDGEATAQAMIEQEFSDMNIRYAATGEKAGRCRAGNLAMEMAKGDYFNFLDDDDLFFADHVEVLVSQMQRNPEKSIVYSLAYATPITVGSRSPYQYTVSGYEKQVRYSYNRLALLHHNLFPIQAVMFRRHVYEEIGGLDETLDVLEDWNLWVRYAMRYDFLYMEKTTSIYRIPAQNNVSEARQKELDDALRRVRAMHGEYTQSWKLSDIQRDAIELIEGAPAGGGGRLARVKQKIKRIIRR